MGKPPGSPKTGGRQKGTTNKSTFRARRRLVEVINAAVDANCTPLEYMLRVLRDPDAEPHRRDQMAVWAAPYVHPKLVAAAIQQVQPDAPRNVQELREWARNEVRKAFDMPPLIEYQPEQPQQKVEPSPLAARNRTPS